MMYSIPPKTLAYSILAGPILWFIHFVGVYVLAEFGCRANFNNLLFFTPETIRFLILVITLPILILVGAGGVFAYRGWINMRNSNDDSLVGERERFLITVALLLSSLFLFSIIITTLPTFFLNVCDLAA